MAQYTVKDNATKKTITFDWDGDGPPTDADMVEVFAAAKQTRSADIVKGAKMDLAEASDYAANRAAFAQEGGVSTFGGKQGGDTRKISYTDSGYRPNQPAKTLKELARNTVQDVVELPLMPVRMLKDVADSPDTGRTLAELGKGIVRGPLEYIPGVGKALGGRSATEAWSTNPGYGAMTLAGVAAAGKAMKGKPSTSPAPAKSGGLAEKAATKLYDMTLKQGTTLRPDIRRQNVKTGLEGGYLPNSKGVDKLAADVSKAEGAIASGIDAGDAAAVRGTLDRAIANVEALRDQAKRSANPEQNLAKIDAELERLRANPMLEGDYVNPTTGEVAKTIPISEVQKMKVEQGRAVKYQQKTGQAVDPFQASIDKARIRGLKEELETQLFDVFPELKQTNQKLGQMYQLQDVLERAASRIENNQGIGIGLPIKGGAGATIGGMIGGAPGAAIGGGIGTMIGIIEHPAVAPRLAMALYKASKGKMTMPQARASANERLDQLKAKLKDQRGLVGKDIDAAQKTKRAKWDNSKIIFDPDLPVSQGGAFDPATGKIRVNPKNPNLDVNVSHEIYHHWANKNPSVAKGVHSRISAIIDESASTHPISKDAIAEAKEMLKSGDLSKREYDRYIKQQVDDHRDALGAGDGLTMASLEEEVAARILSGDLESFDGWFTPGQLKRLQSIVTPAKGHLSTFRK